MSQDVPTPAQLYAQLHAKRLIAIRDITSGEDQLITRTVLGPPIKHYDNAPTPNLDILARDGGTEWIDRRVELMQTVKQYEPDQHTVMLYRLGAHLLADKWQQHWDISYRQASKSLEVEIEFLEELAADLYNDREELLNQDQIAFLNQIRRENVDRVWKQQLKRALEYIQHPVLCIASIRC